MATETRRRKGSTTIARNGRVRVLTAAAVRVHIDNRAEVQRQRSVRQNWQLDSYVYRNSIGELRYAVNYLANCAARMRMFIAVLPANGMSDMPVELTDYAKQKNEDGTPVEDVPAEILAACANAIQDLGNGRVAMANLNHALSTNISLAGEAFLLGQEDSQTGRQTWSVRSVSEIVVMNDELKLREGPVDATGMLGLIALDPELTTISRMWQPDPEWRLLADSPMRAILNECESLLILRRMIRATGRSRLAGRGLLLFPDEVSISVDNDDDMDPQADPVMDSLANAMLTPIANEGDASSVVPIVVRGPADALKEIRLVELSATFDELALKTREELVGIIATGLDLPKEVIEGVADLNHWSAWQVDDNTFRHHIEPHVITLSDCWTSGFLRPYLEGIPDLDAAVAAEWIPRLMFWYDPTELVTHPDRMGNATALHNALAISDEAYRNAGGFDDGDAPSASEIELRMIRTMRTWPANVVMSLLHLLDPTLAVPAQTGPPALPGIDPETGAIASSEAPSPTVPGDTTGAISNVSSTSTTTPEPPALEGPPTLLSSGEIVDALTPEQAHAMTSILQRLMNADAIALTASSAPKWKPSPESVRLSRQLMQIDRDLRIKLTVLANAAMLRHLERVGANLRNKVAKNESLRTKIAQTRNEHVLMTLGEELAKKAGITAAGVTVNSWDQLHDQYMQMTSDAQKQAMSIAQKLAGLSDKETADNVANFGDNAKAGWAVLSDSMNSLAVNLAYAKDPLMSTDDAIAALTPDSLVPTGVVRASLAVSGGTPVNDLGIVKTTTGAEVAAIPLGFPVGGVGTGATVSDLLTQGGAAKTNYEWVHGPSLKPFEPHLELDGLEFTSFTDDALANTTDFPANQYFLPGDHVGCMCDYTPMWVTPDDVQQALADGNVDMSTWPSSAFNTPTGFATPQASYVTKTPIAQAKTPTFKPYDDSSFANAVAQKHGWDSANDYYDFIGKDITDVPQTDIIKGPKYVEPTKAPYTTADSKFSEEKIQYFDEEAQNLGYKDFAHYVNSTGKDEMTAGKELAAGNGVPLGYNPVTLMKLSPNEQASLIQQLQAKSQAVGLNIQEESKLQTLINIDASNQFSTQTMLAEQAKLSNADVTSMSKLSEGQKVHLDYYVGSGYTDMNGLLRLGTQPQNASPESVKTFIASLKRGILKQPPTTGDMIVQRVGYLPSDLNVGKIFTDKGFTSTAQYSGQTNIGRGAKMIIQVPKGTVGLDVNKAYDAFSQTNSFAREKEFILPPGSRFECLSINPDGTYVLKLLGKKGV
jgi:hypothetical protein